MYLIKHAPTNYKLKGLTMRALNFNSDFTTNDDQIDVAAFYDSLVNGLTDLHDLTAEEINEHIDNLQF